MERCGQRLVLKLTVKKLEVLSVVVKPNKEVPEAKLEREQCSLYLTLNCEWWDMPHNTNQDHKQTWADGVATGSPSVLQAYADALPMLALTFPMGYLLCCLLESLVLSDCELVC